MANNSIGVDTEEPVYRFGIPTVLRIPGIAFATGLFGFMLGGRQGFQRASDQFLVENSHRLPRTKGGWYFYHKRKNWTCIKAAVHQGMRSGFKLSFLVTSFFSMEALLDYSRNQVDFLNTLVTVATFGLGYSKYYHLPQQVTKQVLKKGVVLGLAGGLTQDLLRKLRNGDVWYLRKFDIGLQSA